MGRSETLAGQLAPLLEPGETVSHAFVANGGEGRASQVDMIVVAVTDRNVVTAKVSHMTRWKVVSTEVQRWPRMAFQDLPAGGLPGFKRWSWNGMGLWLDRPGRKEAAEANEALQG